MSSHARLSRVGRQGQAAVARDHSRRRRLSRRIEAVRWFAEGVFWRTNLVRQCGSGEQLASESKTHDWRGNPKAAAERGTATHGREKIRAGHTLERDNAGRPAGACADDRIEIARQPTAGSPARNAPTGAELAISTQHLPAVGANVGREWNSEIACAQDMSRCERHRHTAGRSSKPRILKRNIGDFHELNYSSSESGEPAPPWASADLS